MLMEHDLGRAFVRGMEEAATRALGGEADQTEAIVSNARGYLELLREHISKEDEILYPLAERVLPGEKRDAIWEGYRKAEEKGTEGIEGSRSASGSPASSSGGPADSGALV